MDETKTQKIKQYNDKTTNIETDKQKLEDDKTKQTSTSDNKDIIKKKAEETKEQKRIEALQKEEETKKKQEEIEQKQILEKTSENLKGVQEGAINTVSPFVQWLGQQPTPGGLATLAAVIIFLLFIMVPVNDKGDTRMKLLWFTITGKTHLSYEDSTGASGNFSSTSNNNTVNTPIPNAPVLPAQTTVTVEPISNNDLMSILGL